MSVINNVLKDLENRSSQFTPIDIALVENFSRQKPKQGISSGFILSCLSIIVAISIGLYLLQQRNASVDKSAELASIVPAAITIQPELPVEPVAPINQIIDLQISESINNMSLEFSLSGKVVSYLKERTENSFVYHLKGIQSEIIAPTMSKNRWIEAFSLSQISDGVDVSFRTATGVLVETRQDFEDGKQLWAIKLKKVASPAPVARQVEPPVKSPARLLKPDEKANEIAQSSLMAESKAAVAEPVDTKVVRLEIKSSQKKLSSSERLNKARGHLKNRRWNDAEALLLELIGSQQDLAARTLLLSIYQQRQQPDNFAVLLSESIDRYPKQAYFKTEYARSLFQHKTYTKVIDLLTTQKNANAPQLALLAASHQRLDQHQQALNYYRQALDKDAQQARNWIGLGISQEQTTQFEAALRSYRTASKVGSLNSKLQTFVNSKIEQLSQVLN